MRLVVLHNPASGRGNGAARLRGVLDALTAAGHEVLETGVGPQPGPCGLRDRLNHADALIVAGGDGSVHHAAPEAIAAGIPIYHLPFGTENLFAREFGMSDRVEDLIEALRRFVIRTIDTADCNGRAFVIMAGIGFDAAVVGRVSRHRRGGVTRAAYVRHAVDEVREWRVPTITIRADDREPVRDQPGQLIIANLRSYAAGLNPATGADPTDGLLDVVFLPCRTRAELTQRLISVAAGTHADHADVVTARAHAIRVDCRSGEPHLQLDGEEVGGTPAVLQLTVRPASLRVVWPA